MTNLCSYLVILVLLWVTGPCLGQETEFIIEDSDSTLVIETPDSVHLQAGDLSVVDVVYDSTLEKPAAKASLYSAVLPGLGQAYNKKYWKIPIIYGGFAFFGYFIDFSHERYIVFRQLLLSETDQDPRTENNSNLSEDTLRRQTDQWRRSRDLMIGLTVIMYFLNILDAHVDAHLQNFDVGDNVTLNVTPSVDQVALSPTPVAGLSVTLNF